MQATAKDPLITDSVCQSTGRCLPANIIGSFSYSNCFAFECFHLLKVKLTVDS